MCPWTASLLLLNIVYFTDAIVIEEYWPGKSALTTGDIPTITKFGSVEVNQNKDAVFRCSARGALNKQPGVQDMSLQLPDGAAIPPAHDPRPVIQVHKDLTVTTVYFKVQSVKKSHEGLYLCMVSTDVGSGMKAANLTVKTPPSPKSPPVLDGRGRTTLAVRLNAHPFMGDGPIKSQTLIYREVGTTGWNAIPGVHVPSITISGLQPCTSYEARLMLSRPGQGGNGPPGPTATFSTGCDVLPGRPRNVRVIKRTANSLIFAWDAPIAEQEIAIISYEVHFRQRTSSDNANGLEKVVNTSGSVYKFERSGLTPFTVYQVAVRAYSAAGPGNLSTAVMGETKQGKPSAPRQVEAILLPPTAVDVRWLPPSLSNGIIQNYTISYCDVQRILLDEDEVVVDGNKSGHVITGLKEVTTYVFRVRASTQGGPGEFSTYVSNVTLRERPMFPPSDVQVRPISPIAVEVSWLPPARAEYRGSTKITEYKVIYTDDPTRSEAMWEHRVLSSSVQSMRIEGLRPDTVYVVRVAAKTTNFGPLSAKLSARTFQLSRPPAPDDVQVTPLTATTAAVMWSVQGGYYIDFLIIRYRPLAPKDASERERVVYDKTQTRFVLENLIPNTSYLLKVAARNQKGKGSEAVLTFSTPPLPATTWGIRQPPTPNPSSDSQGGAAAHTSTVIFFVLAVAFLLTTVAVLVLMVSYRRRRKRRRVSQNVEMRMLPKGSYFTNVDSATEVKQDYWVIPCEDLMLEGQILGEGNFGQVMKATIKKGDRRVKAAIKVLKEGATDNDRKDFIGELDIMCKIGPHPNVINLIGACHVGDQLLVATEYAPYGSLLEVLRSSRTLDTDPDYAQKTNMACALSCEQLLQMAIDVARGMKFLSEKGCIHRDLAARNVLVGEHMVAKVSDFGLSRGENVYVKTTMGRLPVRWMAVESLTYSVYTTKSDVWSYGILLWEIITLGGTPYCGMTCKELFERLPQGYRMEQPLNCDDDLYQLMRQCWRDRPYDRPPFAQICVALNKMLQARKPYMNMEIHEEFQYADIDKQEDL
ncbi:tyrosine-protein kinase receptor Tie-1-like isoform X1 [Branchiostoma floridae x Branchiostoma japonicum]